MTKLELPTLKAGAALASCAETVSNPARKAKYLSLSAVIEAEETEYISLGGTTSLFSLPANHLLGGIASKDEMVWLYDNKFSEKDEAARKIFYDVLRASAPYGLCPLCDQQRVSTLDHYLAKTVYPAYAITPANLVPACESCNKRKRALPYLTAEQQPLHPYFDNVNDAIWLKGNVVEGPSPTVIFSVNPPLPPTWTEIKRQRTILHFDTLELAEVYTANAAGELAQIAPQLFGLADDGGPEKVREELAQQAQTRSSVAINSWQAAFYRALSDSDWFWQGGHKLLPIPVPSPIGE